MTNENVSQASGDTRQISVSVVPLMEVLQIFNGDFNDLMRLKLSLNDPANPIFQLSQTYNAFVEEEQEKYDFQAWKANKQKLMAANKSFTDMQQYLVKLIYPVSADMPNDLKLDQVQKNLLIDKVIALLPSDLPNDQSVLRNILAVFANTQPMENSMSRALLVAVAQALILSPYSIIENTPEYTSSVLDYIASFQAVDEVQAMLLTKATGELLNASGVIQSDDDEAWEMLLPDLNLAFQHKEPDFLTLLKRHGEQDEQIPNNILTGQNTQQIAGTAVCYPAIPVYSDDTKAYFVDETLVPPVFWSPTPPLKSSPTSALAFDTGIDLVAFCTRNTEAIQPAQLAGQVVLKNLYLKLTRHNRTNVIRLDVSQMPSALFKPSPNQQSVLNFIEAVDINYYTQSITGDLPTAMLELGNNDHSVRLHLHVTGVVHTANPTNCFTNVTAISLFPGTQLLNGANEITDETDANFAELQSFIPRIELIGFDLDATILHGVCISGTVENWENGTLGQSAEHAVPASAELGAEIQQALGLPKALFQNLADNIANLPADPNAPVHELSNQQLFSSPVALTSEQLEQGKAPPTLTEAEIHDAVADKFPTIIGTTAMPLFGGESPELSGGLRRGEVHVMSSGNTHVSAMPLIAEKHQAQGAFYNDTEQVSLSDEQVKRLQNQTPALLEELHSGKPVVSFSSTGGILSVKQYVAEHAAQETPQGAIETATSTVSSVVPNQVPSSDGNTSTGAIPTVLQSPIPTIVGKIVRLASFEPFDDENDGFEFGVVVHHMPFTVVAYDSAMTLPDKVITDLGVFDVVEVSIAAEGLFERCLNAAKLVLPS